MVFIMRLEENYAGHGSAEMLSFIGNFKINAIIPHIWAASIKVACFLLNSF
jgi:hypothetical protein